MRQGHGCPASLEMQHVVPGHTSWLERERLVGLLLDHPRRQLVMETMLARISRIQLQTARRAKKINGGGELDIRDLCMEFTNTRLIQLCKELGLH